MKDADKPGRPLIITLVCLLNFFASGATLHMYLAPKNTRLLIESLGVVVWLFVVALCTLGVVAVIALAGQMILGLGWDLESVIGSAFAIGVGMFYI